MLSRYALLILLGTAVALYGMFGVTPVTLAHPGRTASDGCHYCRTNCSSWGVAWDTRHCHGGGYSQSSYYNQTAYYSQSNYYTQSQYYTQSKYYSQTSYYSQNAYYSQASYVIQTNAALVPLAVSSTASFPNDQPTFLEVIFKFISNIWGF